MKSPVWYESRHGIQGARKKLMTCGATSQRSVIHVIYLRVYWAVQFCPAIGL